MMQDIYYAIDFYEERLTQPICLSYLGVIA